MILILVYVPLVWIGVVAVAMAVATWEVAKRLRDADINVPLIPLLVGGQVIICLSWPYGRRGVLGRSPARRW
ncbi:hypothetical protein GS436_14380 [Rhodococcus hoagii]|nr:hypothetical protein [Prescottella equi]